MTLPMMFGCRRLIAEYNVAKFWRCHMINLLIVEIAVDVGALEIQSKKKNIRIQNYYLSGSTMGC